MSRFTRKALTVTAIAAAVLPVAGATAVATRTIKVPSTVSIRSNGLHFSGKVGTARNGRPCRDHRRVVLFQVIASGPDQPVGRDISEDNGAWSITPQGSAGITLAHFYAKAKRRNDGAAGTIHFCLAAKSKTIKVTP